MLGPKFEKAYNKISDLAEDSSPPLDHRLTPTGYIQTEPYKYAHNPLTLQESYF